MMKWFRHFLKVPFKEHISYSTGNFIFWSQCYVIGSIIIIKSIELYLNNRENDAYFTIILQRKQFSVRLQSLDDVS